MRLCELFSLFSPVLLRDVTRWRGCGPGEWPCQEGLINLLHHGAEMGCSTLAVKGLSVVIGGTHLYLQ